MITLTSSQSRGKSSESTVPPGYKQTELGVIPEDWEVVSIETVARITTGSKNTQDRIEDGKYPFFVRSQSVERIDSYSFDGEAVLTAGDGVGTGKVFHYICGKFDVHQRVYQMSDFANRMNGYYFFLYFSQNFYCRIMQMTAKSSVDSIRRNMISQMLIPVPEMKEQKAIIEAILDIDNLLQSLDRLIAKKRDLKQAAMHQLLNGHTRLPGFEGEWEVITLGDHLTFLRNGTNSWAELTNDGPIKYLHYGEIHACTSSVLQPKHLPSLPVTKSKRLSRLMDGDLIFADASEDQSGIGKSVEICGVEGLEVVSGLHTIAVRFDKNVLRDGFKGYLQYCQTFLNQLIRLAAGTKVFATNRKHIASIEMKLPGIEEQFAIATVLSDMDTEIEALETRRDKTRQLKEGMMQELLTGKTRLVTPGVKHG